MTNITYGTDREVLETVADWLQQDQKVLLVTVVKTWGSSPRPPGSLLAINSDGQLVGSVSGGCIEDDLLARFMKHELTDSFPSLLDYGVKSGEAERYGLPCGGRLELLLELLDQEPPIRLLLKKLEQGDLIRRHICLNTGEVSMHRADAQAQFNSNENGVNQVFGPVWQLLLIGAGQLARYTSRIALMLGYKVIVCDPREQHYQNWHEKDVELTTMMPDEAVEVHARNLRTAIVTLTHDPKIDDMALMVALKSNAFYVGALGSKKTSQNRRNRLTQLDLVETEINKLHAPVGIDIGSHSPPEIALSIMADITAHKNHINSQ